MLLDLLFPLFILAGAGWLLSRGGWFGQGWSDGVGELTSKLLIPALLLSGTYKSGLLGDVTATVLLAFYVPVVLLYLVVFLVCRRGEQAAPLALTSVYSNTVFVGIPILKQVAGENGLAYAFPIIAFHSLLAFSLYYFSSAWKGIGSLFASLARTVKNPIVASLLVGLVLNVCAIKLPAPITQVLRLCADAALPCALLVLGATMSRLRMSHPFHTLLAVACKLLILPSLVLLFGRLVFGLSDTAMLVLLVLSACPVGVNAYPVIHADGRDVATVSSAILLSTLVSMATIPCWLLIVKQLSK